MKRASSLRSVALFAARLLESAAQDTASEAPGQGLREALAALADGDLTLRVDALKLPDDERDLVARAFARARELVTRLRTLSDRTRGGNDAVARASAQGTETLARASVVLDGAAADAARWDARGKVAASAVEDVRDAAERIALLALNAGLEGVRVGGEGARSLTALAEELRRQASRATAGAESMASAVDELQRAGASARAAVEEARGLARSAAQECARASEAVEIARRGERDLEESLRGFALLDEETEAVLKALREDTQRLSRDVRSARERLARVDDSGREALRRALDELDRVAREEA